MASKADTVLSKAYRTIGVDQLDARGKYERINLIVAELQKINKKSSINVKTTGTISERLCELALESEVGELYKRIGTDWNWMADFAVYGHPFNLLISVKSFKAKERLLASGSGNNLSPIVGWGLFDDYKEWSNTKRVEAYLYRSFLAIYMPHNLLSQLHQSIRDIKNINGRPFLRDLGAFPGDLKNALVKGTHLDVAAF